MSEKRWMPVDEWLGQDSRRRPYQQAPRTDDDRPDPNRPIDAEAVAYGESSWGRAMQPPDSGEQHAAELDRRATDGLDGSGGSRT